VDGCSVEAAAKLTEYFKGHARKVYLAMDADPALAPFSAPLYLRQGRCQRCGPSAQW
jgi:hypothetical protein